MLKVSWSEVYNHPLPDGHRFPMLKYDLIPEQLIYEGTLSDNELFHPEKIEDEDILLAHTFTYLNNLNFGSIGEKETRKIGFPFSKSLLEREKYILGGTLACAQFALQFGISMNTAGGTHHAFSGNGEGFCLLNDFAVAAASLLNKKIVQKIVIVDLDVHQGNGTAEIFKNIPEVFTFSMHGKENYPLKKEKSDLDIELATGIEDEEYLRLLANNLSEVLESQKPDIVFFLSGVDVLKTDSLGKLNLSREGCRLRDKFVLELCKRNQIPVVVAPGGGYSKDIKDIVEAHCNTFRLAKEIFF
jgi:acetoin utilization deacetylase AcuC-like enzyme